MPNVEIEYRVRRDGITLHIINASSRQEIRAELTDDTKDAIRRCLDAAERFNAPKQKAA